MDGGLGSSEECVRYGIILLCAQCVVVNLVSLGLILFVSLASFAAGAYGFPSCEFGFVSLYVSYVWVKYSMRRLFVFFTVCICV